MPETSATALSDLTLETKQFDVEQDSAPALPEDNSGEEINNLKKLFEGMEVQALYLKQNLDLSQVEEQQTLNFIDSIQQALDLYFKENQKEAIFEFLDAIDIYFRISNDREIDQQIQSLVDKIQPYLTSVLAFIIAAAKHDPFLKIKVSKLSSFDSDSDSEQKSETNSVFFEPTYPNQQLESLFYSVYDTVTSPEYSLERNIIGNLRELFYEAQNQSPLDLENRYHTLVLILIYRNILIRISDLDSLAPLLKEIISGVQLSDNTALIALGIQASSLKIQNLISVPSSEEKEASSEINEKFIRAAEYEASRNALNYYHLQCLKKCFDEYLSAKEQRLPYLVLIYVLQEANILFPPLENTELSPSQLFIEGIKQACNLTDIDEVLKKIEKDSAEEFEKTYRGAIGELSHRTAESYKIPNLEAIKELALSKKNSKEEFDFDQIFKELAPNIIVFEEFLGFRSVKPTLKFFLEQVFRFLNIDEKTFTVALRKYKKDLEEAVAAQKKFATFLEKFNQLKIRIQRKIPVGCKVDDLLPAEQRRYQEDIGDLIGLGDAFNKYYQSCTDSQIPIVSLSNEDLKLLPRDNYKNNETELRLTHYCNKLSTRPWALILISCTIGTLLILGATFGFIASSGASAGLSAILVQIGLKFLTTGLTIGQGLALGTTMALGLGTIYCSLFKTVPEGSEVAEAADKAILELKTCPPGAGR